MLITKSVDNKIEWLEMPIQLYNSTTTITYRFCGIPIYTRVENLGHEGKTNVTPKTFKKWQEDLGAQPALSPEIGFRQNA